MMKPDAQLPLPLPGDFAAFQRRCAGAASCRPDVPADLVVLTRLYGYVALRLEEAFDRMLAPWELNLGSWLALMMVYWRGEADITPTDVSKALFQARANVTRVTDELVRRGLLTREPSPHDRRVLRLSVTDAGRTLVEEILPHSFATHRAVWSKLSPAQLQGAQDLLSALAQGIESLVAAPAADAAKEPS